MRTKLKCPDCGHYNEVTVEGTFYQKKLLTCDVDAGGCDHLFVAELRLHVEKTIYKLTAVQQDKE